MTALCDKLHTRHTSEADKPHSAVLCFQEVWGNFFLNGGPDFFLHLFQTSPFLLSPYQTIWVIKKMSAGWPPSKQLKQWGQARDFFSHADPAGVANTSAWVLWVLETFNTTRDQWQIYLMDCYTQGWAREGVPGETFPWSLLLLLEACLMTLHF